MKLNELKTKWAGISEGVEFHYGDGWYVTIRSALDPTWNAARAAAISGTRFEDMKPDDLTREIMANPKELLGVIGPAIAEALVVSWRGLENENGEEVPYSVEVATELATGAGMWGSWVVNMASSLAQYGIQIGEADAKKPSNSSDGNT